MVAVNGPSIGKGYTFSLSDLMTDRCITSHRVPRKSTRYARADRGIQTESRGAACS